MKRHTSHYLACIVIALVAALAPRIASAQSQDDGWRVAVYPIFAWVPLGIDVNVNLPGEGGGSGSGPDFGGDIVDARFDGAVLAGFTAAKGPWRFEAEGVWAAVGGDRVDRPALSVDVDLVYARAVGGREIVADLYVTGGVRRVALKYDIVLGGREFSRKPGIWDPLIGIGWHHDAGTKLEVHALVEGGGFGVGADSDVAAAFRLDWKPTSHFGFTGGYTFLYLKVTDEALGQTFTAKQTLHGPIVGIGLYF